eukprot:gene17-608_t
MENKGAILIFKRSIESSELKYTQLVGEGDSSCFGEDSKALEEEYGELYKITKEVHRPLYFLPMLHTMADISSVLEEYSRILHVDWAAKSAFSGVVPRHSAEFWRRILKYTSSTGKQPFKKLALYSLTALATPVRNAICERVFSHVTY